MDGLFTNRPTHPFKVVENDAMSVQSMTSLGRVGRILAGNLDPTSISLDREIGFSIANNGLIIPTTPTTASLPLTSSSPPLASPLPSPSSTKHSVAYSALTDPERGQQYVNQLRENTKRTNNNYGIVLFSFYNNNTRNTLLIYFLDMTTNQQILSTTMNSNNVDNNAIIAGALTSTNKLVLQEPDVIASTKLAHSKTTDSITASGPVAPPRRKKRNKKLTSNLSTDLGASHLNEVVLCGPIVDTDTDSDARSIQSIRDTQKQRIREDLERLWNEKRLNASQPPSHSLIAMGNNATSGNINGGIQSINNAYSNNMNSTLNNNVGNGLHENQLNSMYANLYRLSSGQQVSTNGGAINRISHSLGNSSTSVLSTINASPTIGRARFDIFYFF